MSTLFLKFKIKLESPISDREKYHGPQFHRWLPDGESDAITLTENENTELKVWFEKRGMRKNSGNGIEFDEECRQIVPPSMIPVRGRLDAGPLIGVLKIKEFSDEELAPLRNNGNYEALGRRIIKKLFYRPIAKFLRIIRINYGQYWIPELRAWNSRNYQLGNYCEDFEMEWSIDEGNTWKPFIPTETRIYLQASTIPIEKFPEFLTADDWREIAAQAQEDGDPPLEAELLMRTHQIADEGNLKHAFVEGVSALEIALSRFIDHRLQNRIDRPLQKAERFLKLPLDLQITIAAVFLDKIPLEDTIKAIKIRNCIVHEGYNPANAQKVQLDALLSTVTALIPGQRFKFPLKTGSNATYQH